MADQHCVHAGALCWAREARSARQSLWVVYHITHTVLFMHACRYFAVGWQWFGYWLAFFSVQGPLCLAEAWLSRQSTCG